MMPTIEQTIQIVQDAIVGNRTGLETPIYIHSVRVYEFLKEHGFDEDVQLAGLLHDIIEDGEYSFDQLRELGYNERIIELIDLATYDPTITDKKESWMNMMERLIKRGDRDAWAIKLADMADNLTECHHLSQLSFQGYLFVKAPLFIYYGNGYFGGTDFYNEFVAIYREQVRRYHNYFQE